MFQRILVAVDPSPARHSAVRLAGEMAQVAGADVRVLHVAASAVNIAAVVQHCPKQRQTLLFSATYPEGVGKMASRFMRDPQEVKLAERHTAAKIRQNRAETTLGDCQSATGAKKAFYQCMSNSYNHIMGCSQKHRP